MAGVTGLIVSVGVTVDSYVVYFEKLKDEVRTGRTVRSSVDRAFEKSFRTILAADLVSLIGAAVLYALAIGSVRGFAFFLGVSVLLDLIISYFFMHPLVYFMVAARRAGAGAEGRHRGGPRRGGGDGLMPRATASATPSRTSTTRERTSTSCTAGGAGRCSPGLMLLARRCSASSSTDSTSASTSPAAPSGS